MTIGLPRMHKERGERRDFLPQFVRRVSELGVKVELDHGYGRGMGLQESEYIKVTDSVRFAGHYETYQQDLVLVLRYPNDEELRLMRPGSCLISMIHFPTRPGRVRFLQDLGIEAISLDCVKDDTGRRLVENLWAVGWNGVEVAFKILKKIFPDFKKPNRRPIHITLIGAGAVGGYAMQAAIRYGDLNLWQSMAHQSVPGVQVICIDYDTTCHESIMSGILKDTDILIDATQRVDTSKFVIPNEWIGHMPEHAVLLDLSVDPYDPSVNPPAVKAIEGIPQGNLDQYVFYPDDPAFDKLTSCVNTNFRRTSISCYSWPGIHPKACMSVYGKQIYPLIRTIIEAGGVQNINPQGRFFHRALSRAILSRWSIHNNE